MAVDTTIRVEADTRSAQQNLDQLRQKFDGLKAAIAGVGISALVSQAMNLADAISDLSDATEVSIGSIVAFTRAVQQNGGTAEGAQKGIAKLVLSIDEAANKFGEAGIAFDKVGVSFKDLRTLSTEDIFRKTVDGLSRISDVSERNRLSVALFGKEFRAVATQNLGQSFGANAASGAQFASAVKSAADASDKLANAFATFQLQLLKALKPLNDFISAIDPKKIEIFTQRLLDIASALALLFVATKAAQAVKFVVDAFRALSGAGGIAASTGLIKNAAEGVKYLKNAFDLKSASIVKSYTGFGILGQTLKSLAGGLIRLAPLIGVIYSAITILDGAVEMLTGRNLKGWFDSAAEGLENLVRRNLPGLADSLDRLGEALGMGPAPSVQRANEAENQRFRNRAEAAKQANQEYIRGQDLLKKQRDEISGIVKEFGRANDKLFENLALEARIVGKSEEEIENIKSQYDLYNKYADTRKNLEEKLGKLTEEQQRLGVGGIIKENIKLLEQQYQKDSQGLAERITYLQGIRTIEKDRQATIERITQEIEKQARIGEAFAATQLEIRTQEQEQAFAQSQRGKTPFEQQIAQIRENSRKAALAAGRAFAQAFEDNGDGLTPERMAQLQAGLDGIAASYANLAQQQIDNLQSSRTWAAGWEEAFAAYVDSANNAAEQARGYFETFTRGFEDAIVNFVKTGKLSFKDLVNSLIAEFARLQAQKLFLNLFGDSKGNGGLLMNLFTWGKSLFGLANGGPAMAGNPYIVGERGPELFVPFGNGRVIANNQLGGAMTAPTITNVNYNIQAVDASSFRALVARDPAFIYAVTEKGRQSQPTRRVG